MVEYLRMIDDYIKMIMVGHELDASRYLYIVLKAVMPIRSKGAGCYLSLGRTFCKIIAQSSILRNVHLPIVTRDSLSKIQ